MSEPAREPTESKRSLFSLIGSLPGLIQGLVRAEFDRLRQELAQKLKATGIALALFAVAGVFGFFALGVLVATAILGIAVALPAWLSALIVGVALLLVAGALAFIGVQSLKRGSPPVPVDTIGSVREDVRVITGKGKRGTT